MRTVEVMKAVTTNTTSATQNVLGSNREDYVVHLFGTGTFTVAIEGSFDGTNWYSLASKTANEIFKVAAVPFLRATTSGMAGASVNLYAGV
jgi:hypothetical protein